jgi:hypothetical protein
MEIMSALKESISARKGPGSIKPQYFHAFARSRLVRFNPGGQIFIDTQPIYSLISAYPPSNLSASLPSPRGNLQHLAQIHTSELA